MRKPLSLRATELEYPFFTKFVKRKLTKLSISYVEWIEEVGEEETVESGRSLYHRNRRCDTVAFRHTRMIREIINEWDREKKRIIGK